ncbi:MAG: hypothetical protein P4L84_06360 [Isosphaeraceae bacterium]|nr:hypothetical protein [Isosphaeraceae bacterium]
MHSLIRGLLVSLLWLQIGNTGRAAPEGGASPSSDAGPYVHALWLVHRFGTAEASDPRNDVRTKATLAKALAKDGSITVSKVKALMDPSSLAKFAVEGDRLKPGEVRRALEADAPASRTRLSSAVAAHAALLTTSFDMIDEPHRQAGEELVDWIVENYKPGLPLPVTFVCTGNSRRSILGATMGNVAASYYGLPEIRCYSGGTAPTAFNPRTVKALREIGVEIEPNGQQAPRGEPATANPVYHVRWGQAGKSEDLAPETTEFSKHYADSSNPQKGFAALMVCSEADAGCPVVKGASKRISMPYLDPKIYDGSPFEAVKYAERRDDIGRLVLAVMMQARNRLATAGKLP